MYAHLTLMILGNLNLLLWTQAELYFKDTFVKAIFMFITIF